MTVVDMKKAVKPDSEKDAACCSPDDSDYPYGLNINLDEESMAKLGITKMPEIGVAVQIMAVAKVTSISQSASENHESQNLSLQITSMGVEVGPKKTAADTLYGKE